MFYLQKQILIHLTVLILFAGFTGLFTGCGPGLPDNLKKQAESTLNNIKDVKSKVDQKENKYKSLVKTNDFKQVSKFAIKENWAGKFELARKELSRAEDIYNKKLVPVIKKNKPESAPLVQQEIKRVDKIILTAQQLSKDPFSRFSSITASIENIETLQSKAKTDADQISEVVNKLETEDIAKAKGDFPDLNDKIDSRSAPLSKLARESINHLNVISTVYKDHQQGYDADYAAFTDSFQALKINLDKVKIFEAELIKELDQLYLSYTKILKDMKSEYFVVIKRESWDENSDYYNPKFATFQRQVNIETYDALTEDNIDTIATIASGFSGSKFKNNIGSHWTTLSINPGEQWPGRSHNAAAFWVEDSKEVYYHKYMLEENGETRESEWEKVNASFYEANLAFLGMAILAKPYGVFEKDTLTQPAPPGMAYVGNSKYGEWKKDSSGSSMWAWYGKYALFSTLFFPRPHYYPYNSWNMWNSNYRNRQPYFGKTQKGLQKFGTSGSFIKESPKFQSTNFAKSGGLKTRSASVRGAGANLRGGGPKNKGK